MAMTDKSLDSSPQSHRPPRAAASPWSQVVRGAEPEQTPVTPSPSPSQAEESRSVGESSDNNNGKRPAWNKPSNGNDSEAMPVVMGAVSWPALSESKKTTAKSSAAGADGSESQGAGMTPSSSQRQVSDNVNMNNAGPNRHKSTKRNGPNASFNGGQLQQSAPVGQTAATGFHVMSPKDHAQRSGFGSQNHNVNDHSQQRNLFKNRNGGPHQRVDGSHHNYGNRRDQDRGNHDWNNHRNFNGRDAHMSPRVFPRFLRPPPPPPNSGQYIPPPPVRPFGAPVGFPELTPPVIYVAAPPPDSLRGVSFVPPMPPMFFPPPNIQLANKIVKQIDYYFSDENLIRDTYLRRRMDEQGWVAITLIASFKKVMLLTDNIPLILDALRTSAVVEVQGDKVRRKKEWKKWILNSHPADASSSASHLTDASSSTSVHPPDASSSTSVHPPDAPSSQSLGNLSHDMLLAVQNISLENNVSSDTSQKESSFVNLNIRPLHSTVEGTSEVGMQGSDHPVYAKN